VNEIEAEDWAKIDTMVFDPDKRYLLAFDRILHNREDVEIFLGRLNEIGIEVVGIYCDGPLPAVYGIGEKNDTLRIAC
jgi:hypothetical protein